MDRSVHGLFPLHREVFHLNLTEPLPPGDGIAQLVERPTEKPGAILRRVRISGVARDFSPSQLPVQTLLRCLVQCPLLLLLSLVMVPYPDKATEFPAREGGWREGGLKGLSVTHVHHNAAGVIGPFLVGFWTDEPRPVLLAHLVGES